MTKKKFSPNSTSVSQGNEGFYRRTLNNDKIDESSHSSNDWLSVEDELFYSSSLTTPCSSDSCSDQKADNLYKLSNKTQSRQNCTGFNNSFGEPAKNIENLFKNFNSIIDISDSSIQLLPKMLSEDLLKILESVVSSYEFSFPKQSLQEYKEQFVFFIRICLNNEKLINLVDEYIDTSQDEKKDEILNELKKIEQVFFQTQNLRLTINDNSVKNVEDQSKLLNDFRLFIEISLDRLFKDNLFQSLCDFQKQTKKWVSDNATTINDDPIKKRSSVQEVVETDYLPMDKKNYVENGETDYLPMDHDGYSKPSSCYLTPLKKVMIEDEENRNRFFCTTNEPSTSKTDCGLFVQFKK